jgi:hypothetical protein
MKNYVELAKRRWPNAAILGGGQFAVADIGESGRTLRVFLTDSRERQSSVALGCDHAVKVDLEFDAESALKKMRDPYDPEDRRRERSHA